MLNGLNSEELEYAKIFKIENSLASAKSELSILKRTVERYKETDTTKQSLENQLDASRVKLNIIKKKIPESFASKDLNEISFNPTEETLRTAALDYSPEKTPSEISKIVKKSLDKIEKINIKIKSKINIFEVVYMDGSKETYSIIEHFLNSEKENLISFETDTKKITYTLDEEIDIQILKEISISLLEFPEDSNYLTGYFLSSVPSGGSTAAAFLIMTALGLVGYLFFIKQQQSKAVSLEFISKAKKVKRLKSEGKSEEASSLYNELQSDYLGLSSSQKHEVFKEIKHLHKK